METERYMAVGPSYTDIIAQAFDVFRAGNEDDEPSLVVVTPLTAIGYTEGDEVITVFETKIAIIPGQARVRVVL